MATSRLVLFWDVADLKDPVTDNYVILKKNVVDHAQEYLAKKAFTGPLRSLQIFAISAYQITYCADKRRATETRIGRDHPDDILSPS